MSAAKDKGTWAETQVLKYVKASGFLSAHRQVLTGALDQGDLYVCRGVVAEIKNCKTLSIPAWLRETEVEWRNAGAEFAFCCYKIGGIGDTRVGEWPVVVRQEWLVNLIGIIITKPVRFPDVTWTVKPSRGVLKDDPDMNEVTLNLEAMLKLLRAAGYGEEN